MLDLAVLEFAKQHNFKIGKIVAFGIYKNQLLSIGCTRPQIYNVIAKIEIVHPDFLKELEGFKKDKTSLLKDYQIDHEVRAISWQIHVQRKDNKKELFQKYIDEITGLLSKHQNLGDSKNIVILNSIPMELREAELALNQKKNISSGNHNLLNLSKVLIGSTVVGIILGALLFLISQISDKIPAALIGIILFGGVVFLYQKIIKVISTKDRFLISIIFSISYVFLILTSTLIYLTKTHIDLTITVLAQDLLSAFRRNTAFHILSFFYPLLFTMVGLNQKNSLEMGRAVTSEDISNAKKHILGTKIIGTFIFLCIALLFVLFYILSQLSPHGLDSYVSNKPWLTLLTCSMALTASGFYYLSAKHPEIDLTFSYIHMQKKGFIPKLILILFPSLFFSLNIMLFSMLINIKLDESVTKNQALYLSEKFKICLQEQKCEYCYHLNSPETKLSISSVRFCENEYGTLKEGDEAIVGIRSGFFNIPWVSSASLVKMKSLANLLLYLKSESELRFAHVKYFKEKGEIQDKQFQDWENKCASLQDYNCRLASYLYSMNKNESQSLKLLNIGCKGGDSVACLGIFHNPEATPQQKSMFFEDISRSCFQSNKIDSCITLGSIRWNEGYKENYKILLQIYEKICSAKQDKDSCTFFEYLKKHPVKMD